MVKVYKGDRSKEVYSIDLQAWLEDGWTTELPAELTLEDTNKINLNSASVAELKSLPSVNVAIAKKIVDGRPYQSVEDLPLEIDKEAIKDKVYFGEFTPVNKS